MLELKNHSPNKLSGGQKQRLAISGIMAMQPKCIILDEPTAMLDPLAEKK
jgi:energy-coupling factor transport system ATP-binding protein